MNYQLKLKLRSSTELSQSQLILLPSLSMCILMCKIVMPTCCGHLSSSVVLTLWKKVKKLRKFRENWLDVWIHHENDDASDRISILSQCLKITKIVSRSKMSRLNPHNLMLILGAKIQISFEMNFSQFRKMRLFEIYFNTVMIYRTFWLKILTRCRRNEDFTFFILQWRALFSYVTLWKMIFDGSLWVKIESWDIRMRWSSYRA